MGTYVRHVCRLGPGSSVRASSALYRSGLAAFRRAAREASRRRHAGRRAAGAVDLEGDDPAFESAAVRWINRFTGECPCLALTELQAAVEALDGLADPDANATLSLDPPGWRRGS